MNGKQILAAMHEGFTLHYSLFGCWTKSPLDGRLTDVHRGAAKALVRSGAVYRPVPGQAWCISDAYVDRAREYSQTAQRQVSVQAKVPLPTIDEARDARLKMGLLNLAHWCFQRAAGDHDDETTLTMLETKANELRSKVLRAGWAASNATSPSVGATEEANGKLV